MATGNRRRRLLRRKQKARELKARCERWQAWDELERACEKPDDNDYLRWMPSPVPLTEQDQRRLEHEHWYETVAIPADRWREIQAEERREIERNNDLIMSTIDLSWSD